MKLSKPFADLLPPLASDDLEGLRTSIAEEGFKENCLATEDGRLLDGHHRLAIDPKAVDKVDRIPGSATWSDDECRAYIFRCARRRNMSPDQKKEVRRQEIVIARALRKEDPRRFTTPVLSQMFGVTSQAVGEWLKEDSRSGETGFTTSTIPDSRTKIPPQHKPIIADRVSSGETQAQVAADYGVSQRQVSNICRAVEKDREKKAAVDEVLKRVSPADVGIVVGDFRKAGARVADGSVQLIFTDPPYDDASIGLYGDLASFAARVLVPGGLCLAYAGKHALPGVYATLADHLEYVWTCIIYHKGGCARFRKCKVQTGWKPILCFGRPPVVAWWEWFADVASGGREKDTHEWQQAVSEAEHFIKALTRKDGLVCDPFLGGGSTCLAARNLGRPYLAFEIDPETSVAPVLCEDLRHVLPWCAPHHKQDRARVR